MTETLAIGFFLGVISLGGGIALLYITKRRGTSDDRGRAEVLCLNGVLLVGFTVLMFLKEFLGK